MLNYYVFENPTLENQDFYFKNKGIFNIRNEYLIIHINNCNLVVVNKPKFKLSGNITAGEWEIIKTRIRNEFCGSKGCNVNTISSSCEIIRDWGKDICDLIYSWINNTER